MKNIFLIFVLAFASCFSLQAQNVSITEDSDVSSLLQRHIDQNRSSYYVSGWRIQLLSTTDRRKVESEETNFLQELSLIHI